ncbi:hypothetical protein Tco_0978960 [Tanacetum coccineum]|uniref:Reverse transcriptase domain-containing protein n=1 Tax=Tanacetum coccineum TaxID=301880 RepID=A0ABQ5EQ21_9ASTR
MGFPFKCFLVAYKGYHQIQMSKEDKEKTSFYTDQGTYCYTKMLFRLKNAGAIYKRLVDLENGTHGANIRKGFGGFLWLTSRHNGHIQKVGGFGSLDTMGQNLEAYVDDMVIKRNTEQEMIMDINKPSSTFKRANPKKTTAVTDMQSLKTLKEIQSLSGKLAVLNRFLSRSVERALPFFETLKNITNENKDDYRWAEDAKRAFQEMKTLIIKLPKMTTPLPKEALFVYLAASKYMNAIKGQHGRMDLVYKWSIKMEGSGCWSCSDQPTGTEYTRPPNSTQDEGTSTEGKGRLKAGSLPVKWQVHGKQ